MRQTSSGPDCQICLELCQVPKSTPPGLIYGPSDTHDNIFLEKITKHGQYKNEKKNVQNSCTNL